MDFTKLGAAAAAQDDLTQAKEYERDVPRAGVALLRLRDYIELGRFSSANPTHKPAEKCMLVFELSHPDHLIEIDGKKVPQTIVVRLSRGTTAKSGYRKLFNCMNIAHGGTFQHFVQLVGKAFLGEIYHNTVGEGDKKATYANLDLNGAWSLKAPVQVDVINNTTTPINVRELDGKPRVFLWENNAVSDSDIHEMWNSLYIEGTRQVTDKASGVVREVSKNWLQDSIMENLDWEGSRTQSLVQAQVNLDEPVVTPAQTLAAAAVPSLDD